MIRVNELETEAIKPSLTTGMNKATIADVARLAGVSIKTVSRVANGESNVREVTRARVQSAIDTLSYVANPYARYLSQLRVQGAKASANARAVKATG